MLFDLDDTLLDTSDSATRVWRQTAEAFAGEIGRPVAEFGPVLDAARRWYWSDPERNRLGRLDVQRSRVEVTLRGLRELGHDGGNARGLAERFAGHYAAHRVRSMRFFPGALGTLRAFRAAGIKLALITNGDAAAQREKVTRFGLAPLFEGVFIEGELGYGKPDPRVFAAALRACGGVDPAGAWCVGDHLGWEVRAAQELGLVGVWVDWRGEGLPEAGPRSGITPDRTVRRVAELQDVLAGA
ncbi:HAD family hydrolase [Phycisphaera mikurensis]|uniref:Putative hydrolase n=1 Tax=Phycisphaera mikurensis (strain NBRC 102666 / KCTC 22515 / FYK2301M01) TaxID=1142394 RepID=I0IIV1_PHYMF|nr:HAD family hydrolase [Phycisphaera mikurensis]MBB6443354.1 putative hydrolase of the HAD superfamily [Phycisphaera mikurensis]BAM05189.1 putative hydrolase [Phycisphaera mikurensis NBRC 102666]